MPTSTRPRPRDPSAAPARSRMRPVAVEPAAGGGVPAPNGTAAPRPPYARVKQYLKDALEEGRWAPGAQMPSEATLVAQFGVSRMTVHRALRELQDVGLITRL